jgi:hypothetical protein
MNECVSPRYILLIDARWPALSQRTNPSWESLSKAGPGSTPAGMSSAGAPKARAWNFKIHGSLPIKDAVLFELRQNKAPPSLRALGTRQTAGRSQQRGKVRRGPCAEAYSRFSSQE